MVDFNLSEFSTIFKGGARSYLFKWNPTTLNDYFLKGSETGLMYFLKSTSLPATTIEENITSYQHINYKSPNKKIFDDWNVTINCDKEGYIREGFESWSQDVHMIAQSSDGFTTWINVPKTFAKLLELDLLGYDMLPIMNVKLYDAWPKSIGAMTLDYGSQEISTFDVTFSYMYHEIKKV